MCLTDNEEVAETMRMLRDHGMDPEKKYWHNRIGFNYRMTNLQAALGVAQLKKLDLLIQQKRRIAEWYGGEFEDLERKGVIKRHPEMHWAKGVYWMNSILIEEGFPVDRDELIKRLERKDVETRRFFYPVHMFPMYNKGETFPVSEELSRKGMNLPSSANLKREDVRTIAEHIRNLS